MAGLYAKLGEAPLFAGGNGLEQAAAPAGGVLLPGSSSAPVWWREDGQLEAVWTFTLKNPSGTPATLPEWSFWLEDGEGGRIYSLTPDRKPAGTAIEPGGELDIALTAVLPLDSALHNPTLILARTIQETGTGAEVPVAAFPIPGILGHEPDGSSRSIETESGTFTAELTALERWPWTDQDLITAAVTLTNTSSKAVAVPQLEGVLVADGTVEWAAKTVRGDSVRLLQPGQSSLLFVQAKVDPEEAVGLWDVRLQAMAEAEGGAAAKPLCRVEWSGVAAASAKKLPAGSPAKLPNTAAGWAWTASAPIIYESASEQLVAVRMDAVNGEKRYAPPGQWVAQFRTADGTMYPAEMESTSKRVIPSGTASLVAWTRLPKGVALDGLGLMLGQAVTGTSLSQPGEKPDAFLQAAVFQLPGRQGSGEKPGDLTKPVNLYPYTFEITDMVRPAWFYNDKKALFQLNFSFEYMLAKQWNVVSEMKSRRIVLQLLDGQNHLIQEKSYELDPQDAAADGLLLDSDKKEWIVEMKDLSLDLSSFTVALYEEFLPGFRRLIGSTTSEWY
ncbi:hypothetical protein [Paenibacillus sp. YN15]|uniref:hypothetical protein n=1 Tax=Paenibacillus sp. YN15 TaxID=1742774 RepID=UPI0011BED486|nr:hypothetical protein [Paenibacillus sp. YN15]